MSDELKAQELISIFVCSKDRDIENFLREKAILFEKLGKSRTFFVFDEEAEKFQILGYFTLALQVLKIPEELSNRKIKEFDGFSAKARGERILEFPVILIGQLAKNESCVEPITGVKLMKYCLNMVFDGQMHLGGRIIVLECKDIPYLIEFYGRFGFSKLEKDYQEDDLIQLMKVLQEDDIIDPSS